MTQNPSYNVTDHCCIQEHATYVKGRISTLISYVCRSNSITTGTEYSVTTGDYTLEICKLDGDRYVVVV